MRFDREALVRILVQRSPSFGSNLLPESSLDFVVLPHGDRFENVVR